MGDTIVPDCSGGTGNTISVPPKQISPAKRWCFTFNNYTDEDISSIVSVMNSECKFYIIGKEIGKVCGTKHLQGYCEFIQKVRPKNMFSTKIHWEKCRGNRQDNVDYCKKDGEVIASKGLPKPIKVIENLYPWQKEIEDIILQEPNDRKVYWFWDETGNIGKSSFIKYCCVKYRVAFCCGGKYSDIMNLIFNTDMDACSCVMFDIPRCSGAGISYSSIESIKNGLVCNTKYETGYKVFNSPHVVVFANSPPDIDMLSEDRWIIKQL